MKVVKVSALTKLREYDKESIIQSLGNVLNDDQMQRVLKDIESGSMDVETETMSDDKADSNANMDNIVQEKKPKRGRSKGRKYRRKNLKRRKIKHRKQTNEQKTARNERNKLKKELAKQQRQIERSNKDKLALQSRYEQLQSECLTLDIATICEDDGDSPYEPDTQLWNDLNMSIIEAKMKEIRFQLKVIAYWCKSDISLVKLKEHIDLEHLYNRTEGEVWSTHKISDFCETKLGVLNKLILGIKMDCFVGKEIGLNFDETTKCGNKYMNLNVSHSYNCKNNVFHQIGDKTDVAMMCVGYDRMYGGNNVSSHYVLEQMMTELDVYIKHWNDSHCVDLLQRSFGPLIRDMTFVSVFKRTVIGLTDRHRVNDCSWELLKPDCDRLTDYDILFSCTRHDMDNGWVQCRELNKKKHTKENGLKGIKHGIAESTYIAKLIKPDSKWDKNKSKYFAQLMKQRHPKNYKFILDLVNNLKCQKGQRNLNLLSNGIYILLLTPYLLEMQNMCFNKNDLYTNKALDTILALKSPIIKSELIKATFIRHRLYNHIIRSTLQYSMNKCRIIFLNSLTELSDLNSLPKLFPVLMGLPGFGVNYTYDSFSFDFSIVSGDECMQKIMEQQYPSFNELIVNIIAVLYNHEDDSTESDAITIELCTECWVSMQQNCRFLIISQNVYVQHLFSLSFQQIFELMNELLTEIRVIYRHLSVKCKWNHHFKTEKDFTEHIRNNADKVESGNGICSYILSRSPRLSPIKLKNKLMAIDNKIVEFLNQLLIDESKIHVTLESRIQKHHFGKLSCR